VDVPDDAADMNTAEAHADQGDRLRRQHRAADAEAAYRAAIALDPQLPRAHSGLSLVLRDTGRRADAKAAFAEATRLDPACVDLGTYLRVRRSLWLKSLRITRRPHTSGVPHL
jgi:tetratricopeptide (TPR) repeat protein